MGTTTPARSVAGTDARDTSPWATGLTLFAGINQGFV